MTTDLRHDHTPEYDCTPACPAYPDNWSSRWAVPATGASPAASQLPPGAAPDPPQPDDEEARRSQLAGRLEAWWESTSEQEMAASIPKAIEYSSTDLVDLGRQIAQLAGWGDYTDAHLAELGIAFYVAGKVARVMGAIREGRLPSTDTWHDIAVYTKMAQRVREVGAWPGL